ncbi:MAG: pilus assembly PilX N-terminal domain-containing protein [Clostridia bacterium]|nr:pilus assembly PilX N-terminal domain-containing protein [Clostridia bacterium]
MFNKMLHNNKGMALALVIVALTILSTVGLAIMSLSIAHLKVSYVDRKGKISFYMAESGLEQAYGLILDEVANAVKVGNTATNASIKEFLDAEKEHENTDPDYDSVYLNDDGTINEAELKRKLDKCYKDTTDPECAVWYKVFADEYREYLNNCGLDLILVNPDNYEGGGVAGKKPAVWVMGRTFPLYLPEDMSCKLTLSSAFFEDDYKQEVEMDFTMDVPTKIPQYFFVNAVVDNKVNPIWDCVVTSCGEIKMKGTSNVVVYGDVSTSNNVAFKDSNASSLTINGNLYADNLIVDGEGVTYKNNDVTISGELYTYDDLEINGLESNVKIDGGYFGFSDGSGGATHDQSSGIVINSEDFSKDGGSTLEIGGETFICGTSYISVEGGPYQTGESISIKGNYRAYSHKIPGNYEYKYYEPLYLVHKKDGAEMVWDDKAEYFNEVYNNEPSLINIGATDSISLSVANGINILGAYINNNTVSPGMSLGGKIGDFEAKKTTCSTTYNAKTIKDDVEFYNSVEVKEEYDDGFELFKKDDITLYASGYVGYPNSPTNKEVTSPIDGIIVSEGTVYLCGDINFSGLIVAKNGVVFMNDTGSQTVTLNKKYVVNKLSEIRNTNPGADPFEPGYEDAGTVVDSSYGFADAISINAFKEYVKTDNWKGL